MQDVSAAFYTADAQQESCSDRRSEANKAAMEELVRKFEEQLEEAKIQYDAEAAATAADHAQNLEEAKIQQAAVEQQPKRARFEAEYHAKRSEAYDDKLCAIQTYFKHALYTSGIALAVLMLHVLFSWAFSILVVGLVASIFSMHLPDILSKLVEYNCKAAFWVIRWLLQWLGWKGWLVLFVVAVLWCALKLVESTMVKLLIVVFSMAGLQLLVCEWSERSRDEVDKDFGNKLNKMETNDNKEEIKRVDPILSGKKKVGTKYTR